MHIQTQQDINIWAPQYFVMVTFQKKPNMDVPLLNNHCIIIVLRQTNKEVCNFIIITQSLNPSVKVNIKFYFILILVVFFDLLILMLNNKSLYKFRRDWKIIPLNYINNFLGKNFKFYSKLSIPNKTINSLPSYYKDIIDSSCKYYSCTPEVLSLVSSQFLWYNS